MKCLHRITLLLMLSGTCTASETITFNIAAGETTESVVVDRRGNLYTTFGFRPAVAIIPADRDRGPHVFQIPARLPEAMEGEQPALGALGLTLDKRKNIFVAVQGCVLTAARCSSANGVWLIPRGGKPVRLRGTHLIAFPNSVTLDREGNLYISDSITGAIWLARKRYDGRNRPHYERAQLWFQHDELTGNILNPIGANGIAFSRGSSPVPYSPGHPARRDEIIVANSARSSVLALPILDGGHLGEPELIAGGFGADRCPTQPLTICDFRLAGVDGIALDRYGDIFAVTPVSGVSEENDNPIPIFGPSRLLNIKRRTGEVTVIESDKLELPATGVATSPGFARAKHVWIANPGFFDFSTPTLQKLDLETIWMSND